MLEIKIEIGPKIYNLQPLVLCTNVFTLVKMTVICLILIENTVLFQDIYSDWTLLTLSIYISILSII